MSLIIRLQACLRLSLKVCLRRLFMSTTSAVAEDIYNFIIKKTVSDFVFMGLMMGIPLCSVKFEGTFVYLLMT